MAKLIDADALMKAITKKKVGMTTVVTIRSAIADAPDASEPILAEAIALRARVEALEAEKAELVTSLGQILRSPSLDSGQYIAHGSTWNKVGIRDTVYCSMRDLWIKHKELDSDYWPKGEQEDAD